MAISQYTAQSVGFALCIVHLDFLIVSFLCEMYSAFYI